MGIIRVLALVVFLGGGVASAQTIETLQINPQPPTVFDLISVTVMGELPTGAYYLDSVSPVGAGGYDLYVDMYWDEEFGIPESVPYMETVDLGVLEPGIYNLTVTAYAPGPLLTPTMTDQKTMLFEVFVPEPASLGLFALGGLALLRRRRTH